MSTTVHLVTGEYAPGSGGVADYTRALERALHARGLRAHVWQISGPDMQGALEAALERDGGCVLLQYVPNALGRRGANVPFCLWLLSLRRRGHDIRVMFHEPYLYFAWTRPLHTLLATTQRLMALILLRASIRSYLSTMRWIAYLEPLAPKGHEFVPLPIAATVPVGHSSAHEGRWAPRLRRSNRRLVGHFGTYGEHVASALRPIAVELLRCRPEVDLVCIGRGSEAFVRDLTGNEPGTRGRVIATGAVEGDDVSAIVRLCDVAIQPYPDGVTTRRTSVMAAVANGVPTVTSRGVLTEAVWDASGAVVFAPAGDAAAHVRALDALLDDGHARAALALRGRQAYESIFSIERTADTFVATLGGLSQ